MTARVLAWALQMLESGSRVAIASVVKTSGSVPGKTGARLAMALLGDEVEIVGTVGGAGLEMKVINECEEMLKEARKPTGEVLTYGLNKGAKGYEVTPLDSLCGGRVTVAIEVMIPMPHILLMGGGHCGLALANAMQDLGWEHSVHDTRSEFSDEAAYPLAKQRYTSSVADFLVNEDSKSLKRFSDILLLGHDWSEDLERLIGILSRLEKDGGLPDGISGPRIGVIVSKSQWGSFSNSAIEAGISQQCLDLVICPIGLNIGAESPEEIAVAVLAQVMANHKGINPQDANWRQK